MFWCKQVPPRKTKADYGAQAPSFYLYLLDQLLEAHVELRHFINFVTVK